MGSSPYQATEGSIAVSLDKNNRLTGEFNFLAAFGSKSGRVSNGTIDVTGFITPSQRRDTGVMRGEVDGGPMPTKKFEAQVVSISSGGGPGIPDYWEVTGRHQDVFPPVWNHIAILVDKDVSGSSFDLKDNQKVRVVFGRLDTFGFAYSISGTLQLTSMPASGRAVGTLDCLVQQNQDAPFSIQVSFDINDQD